MIVILADDLTGASDAAATFAALGYSTALRLRPGIPTVPVDVCSFTANNRHLSPQAAYEAARTTLLPVADSLSHLFIKIDSTMRGPILPHILGALSAKSGHGDIDAGRVQSELARSVEAKEDVEARSAEYGSRVTACQTGKMTNIVNEHSSLMALICPAYPEMGRQVINQVVLVDGTPLAETAIADDPVTMVQNSTLAGMLDSARFEAPKACGTQHFSGNPENEQVVALKSEGDWEKTLGRALGEGVRVATVDAATRADLAELADGLAKFPQIVPVGSAGLAAECARIWAGEHLSVRRSYSLQDDTSSPPAVIPSTASVPSTPAVIPLDAESPALPATVILPKAGSPSPQSAMSDTRPCSHRHPQPTLVLISSCHPANTTQLDLYLAHYRESTVVLSPDLKTATDPDSLTLWLAAADLQNADTIIVVRPEERAANPEVAAGLASILGAATAALVRRIHPGTLVLVGGDGAAATLNELGVTELKVNPPLAEGIGSATAIDGSPGLSVVTKAGGFGGPETLTRMVAYYQQHMKQGQVPCRDKEVR